MNPTWGGDFSPNADRSRGGIEQNLKLAREHERQARLHAVAALRLGGAAAFAEACLASHHAVAALQAWGVRR